MAAVTSVEIASAGLYFGNGCDFVLDFERTIACMFVSPEYADSFASGAGFAIACIFAAFSLGQILVLAIDMIRDKLGLPVARYVRWVKQQDKIDKGGEK